MARRPTFWVVAASACAVAFGCRHQNPFEYKKELQKSQAKQLKPAELEHAETGWRAFRVLRVRAYADEAFIKKDGDPASAVALQDVAPKADVRRGREDESSLRDLRAPHSPSSGQPSSSKPRATRCARA